MTSPTASCLLLPLHRRHTLLPLHRRRHTWKVYLRLAAYVNNARQVGIRIKDLALAAVIGPEVETQVTWLQSKGLLGRNKTCPACNQQMDMQHRSDITDKYRWRCPDSSCKKSVSLRSGSFFEQSRLKLRQWIVLMYWWAREYPRHRRDTGPDKMGAVCKRENKKRE